MQLPFYVIVHLIFDIKMKIDNSIPQTEGNYVSVLDPEQKHCLIVHLYAIDNMYYHFISNIIIYAIKQIDYLRLIAH